MSKTLIISCHLGGGCFHYSNEIISRLTIPSDIYVPKKTSEPSKLKNTRTFLLWGYTDVIRYLSLALLLMKIVFLGIFGYYNSLVLFGYAGWDYLIMKAWKLTGKPSYFVVHDGKMHSGEANNKRQKELTYIMSNATHLVFLSEYVCNLVKENFGIQKPYHIAPHGLIDYGKIERKEQADIPTLLFLGRVTAYKGIDTLISAMELVPFDCYKKLIIAGKWSSNMQAPNCHEKLEVINKHLTNDEILEYIGQADVMLFPYKEATQSGVATLALNYHKPSIATNVGAFKEQFTEETAVFVEPENPIELASSITAICQDIDKRNCMVEASKFEARKVSWDNIAHNFEYYITINK